MMKEAERRRPVVIIILPKKNRTVIRQVSLQKDRFSWLRDDEFARQALAGVNPVSIEKLKVFPPVSQLDPEIYSPQESALKEEHILGYLNGMTVQQAIKENKLFIIDYHDIYLPFLDRINALDERKAYATRTIFFLTPSGTLKPIAIELSLPRALPGSQLKRVLTPPIDATSNWTWQLRTHAAMEPFILSAHRQLSAMHPIYKLLDPHMRYTLEINAIARQNLLNADGVIEQGFTPGRYCMEISAAAYKHWRFNLEGLPADLIRRGMAVPEPKSKTWTKASNRRLPICFRRTFDLRSYTKLANAEDLTAILTTIIWLASAQHAALNFGQYPYGGYIPNRPPRMRRLIPDENDPEYTSFLEDPQNYFLLALPSIQQRDTWSGDAEMVEAFYGFASEIQRIEKEIEKRNRDMSLKNRCGAGVLPYELLAPSSEPGVTCRGIPNSVSIRATFMNPSVSKEWKSLIDSREFIAGYGFRHTQPPRFMLRYLHYQEHEKEDELLDEFTHLFNIDMFDTSVNKILGFMKRVEPVLESCQELEESDLSALYLAI
ncbi:linoleate 13S-lipoxygenase 3-1, chloroplastic-like protein [Tanacetum coccineum]|uniref:Lipoxygenase n=1 Tax=Tanacetum coccineum TaxID=301880 RepID=A0ABQ4XPS8_9ASTR